jgi:hypothetical protein
VTTLEQQVFDFTFALSRHDSDRPLRPFQRRDGVASTLLIGALMRLGYGYGEPLFNQPPVEPPEEDAVVPLIPMDLSFVNPGDLILQTTRPPIHDKDDDSMKQVERGYTGLEQTLFDLWVPNYLSRCSRQQVSLSLSMASHLRQGFEDRASMNFMQRGDLAPYTLLSGRKQGPNRVVSDNRTAVFLLNEPALWKDGPGYLCAFGLSGVMTMVWAYKLAKQFPHLLTRPGFFVYELEVGPIPERALNLQWCRDWKLEPVLTHEFGPGPRALPVLG